MFKAVVKKLSDIRMSWGASGSASGAPGYDVVGDRGDGKRRPASIETKHEDEILNASQRLKVLNLTREGMRNAPQVRAIVQQLRVMVVGLQGGKLTLTTEDGDWNAKAQAFFGERARNIDFIDGTSLNDALKLILTALAAEGGDYAMIFDDGSLTGGTGTGKIRFFESDNIANLEDSEFKKRFGEKWTQAQGLIYNEVGRFVGIVLSGKKRGKQTFAADECFTLTRDPDASAYDAVWFFGKRKWRLLQGRGVSPQTVAIAALLDMYELVASEVQSGKLNSKLFAQVIDSVGGGDNTDGSQDVGDGVADDESADGLEDDAGDAGADEATGRPGVDVTELEATTGGVVVNNPFGSKLEVLDSKRPNPNMIMFVEWLNGGAAAVHGLARVYSGLKAETSYTAYRGEQTITWASIEESQKELERGPLDWIGVKTLRWGMATGRLDQGPDGWESKLEWSWPQMREVNEVDAQSATAAKLKNFLATYRALLGPNWKEILTQVSDEVKWFAQNQLVHPSQQTVSGQVVTPSQNDPAKRGKDTEK